MLLLPDIKINNTVLSIPEPYTINGEIIINIEICDDTTYNIAASFNYYNGYIILKTESDTYYRLSTNELDLYFKKEMNRFIARNGHRVQVEGYRYVYDWSSYLFSSYIYDIKKQCTRISEINVYNYSYYIRTLKKEVTRQGRSCSNDINRTTISSDEINYNRTIYNNINFRNNCSITFDSDNNSSRGHRSNFAITFGEPVVDELKRTYLHKYDYKPEYIYHYMPNEDKDTTALFGIELEVAGNENEPDREETVKKCIQIINGSDDDSENLIYSTKDSTVQIELDTMPASFEFHKNKMNYKELFKYLDEIGYKGHDCSNAGLHIHINRKYLGKSELIQQLTISKILYILEKFNDEICVIARRNNSYSKFVGKDEVNKSLNKLYNK